jgi:hypothetical protein
MLDLKIFWKKSMQKWSFEVNLSFQCIYIYLECNIHFPFYNYQMLLTLDPLFDMVWGCGSSLSHKLGKACDSNTTSKKYV